MEAVWRPREVSDTLMISPDLFGLPVLSDFNLVVVLRLFNVLEVFLADGTASAATVGVREDVLALRDILVAFKLPEDGPPIVSATSEKSANVVPANAIDGLLVVAQLG